MSLVDQAREGMERAKHAVTVDESDAITVLLDSLDGAERFATHDPGVNWPSDEHDSAIDAILAAFDREREERAAGAAWKSATSTPDDHAAIATRELERADEWANRDGAMTAEHRAAMVEWHLRHAEVHATLAVAEQVNHLTARTAR